jgi:hypothetical protein
LLVLFFTSLTSGREKKFAEAKKKIALYKIFPCLPERQRRQVKIFKSILQMLLNSSAIQIELLCTVKKRD